MVRGVRAVVVDIGRGCDSASEGFKSMRFCTLLDRSELGEDIRDLGFDSLDEVLLHATPEALYQHILRRAGRAQGEDESLRERCRRAHFLASKRECAARDAVSLGDPVARALRHAGPAVRGPSEPVVRYVRPGSIQSAHSPAAYLRYIYDLARRTIQNDGSAFALDRRRPDLRNLVLSEDNLKLEVSTLSLVNEILTALLIDKGVAPDPDTLVRTLAAGVHPFALPFSLDHATVREALAAMSLGLNAIARRGRPDGFALADAAYSVVPHRGDRLRLYAAHLDLLRALPAEDELYDRWYGRHDRAALGDAGTFCAATGLTYDELLALLGQDCDVADETGSRPPRAYAEFLAGGHDIRLRRDERGRDVIEVAVQYGWATPPPKVHELQNKCIRLQRRTGLPFHALDWLLTCALRSRPNATHDTVLQDGSALDVLAHFLEYRDTLQLGVDAFAALIYQINPLHRSDSDEPSLLRRLFGAHATALQRALIAGSVQMRDLDPARGLTELGEALRGGLAVTSAEWSAVAAEVAPDEAATLDAPVLARLYRVVTVLRSLRWGVLEGLALVRALDPALLRTLATGADSGAVLPAIDRLLWLSTWMQETGFTPLALIAVVAPPDPAHVYPNQDTLNWVVELQQAIQPALVTPNSLRPYTIWNSASGDPITVGELELWAALAVFFSDGLVQHEYLVQGPLGVVQISLLSLALKGLLTAKGVDLSIPENQERFDEMFEFLVEKENEQAKVLAAQVIKHTTTLSEAAVTPTLRWMGTNPFEALKVFMAWNTEKAPANPQGMALLLDLRRHLLVVSRLRLDESEIALVALHPDWLAVGMTTPLCLRQVYLLGCLKRLENAEVSANDWLAYFTLARSPMAGDSRKLLARLLDWPERDLALLADAPDLGLEGGVVTTVEQADFVARRIALCRDGSLAAEELLALARVTGDAPDWPGAAQAALAGLRRAQGGAHVAAAQGSIDEEHRDALVAVTLTAVMARDPELQAQVTDDERLYEYLLLDVKVSAQVPTTRLLEATGSVQLYVNQVLEGVEHPRGLDRDALRAEWEVACQYRVWEANESLILYPSNYIEPELRRGKSELFRQFEQAVTQGELNEDLVRAALVGYVAGLQRLTELQPHGFFYTRNAAPMTYFFTARATHEQYGYYVRRLEVDMDRLSTGEPMHALRWGDWEKASAPVASQHVYGVVPAFAYNRLFLLWFELERVTRTEHGNPVDSYYLRPKYSRQNLDGTFTEAQALTQTGFELDVTADIPVKRVKPGTDDPTEEPAPEMYAGPTIYQPCYQPGTDSLLLPFTLPARSPWGPARAFSWTVRPNASTLRRETTLDASTQPHTLDDYTSVPHALQLVTAETRGLQPTRHDATLLFSNRQGSGWMKITSDPEREFTLELRADPEREDVVTVVVPAQLVWLEGADGSDKWSGVPYNVRHTLTAIRLNVSVEPARTESILLFAGNERFGELSGVHLPESAREVTLPADVAYGSVRMTLVFECTVTGILDRPLVFNQRFETSYARPDKYISHLYYGKDEAQRPGEYYLLTEIEGSGAVVFALGSSAMRDVTLEAGSLFDMFALLRPSNQQRAERGVADFLHQAEGRYQEILDPRPRTALDFDGPFGLYAWELFYHIPSLVSAAYRNAGKFEVARQWLHAIYDPGAEPDQVWRCHPLRAVEARSLSIADPDRLATENPGHYRLATVRQYLRTMTEQGDAHYRQETAETLRLARMWYVSALRLFTEEVGDSLLQATRSEWTNPALGAASIDFRAPYNQDLRDDHATIERRLDDLRHWRGFDGEPLQIPLLAPKLNPRELQLAAVSGLAATAAGGKGAQMRLPFTFPEALSKAKEAVRNLMYFGDLLAKGLYRRDEQVLAEMQARLAHHVAADFERGGQESLIGSMELELGILKKSRDEAQESLDWYEFFAGELFNGCEIAAFPLWALSEAAMFGQICAKHIEGGLRFAPTIYGMAVGGGDFGAPVAATANTFEQTANITDRVVDAVLLSGEALRRQQENKKERDVAKLAVERIDLEIARLNYDLEQEEGTLVVLQDKARRTEAIVDFHARRATSADFHGWYVGRMTSLYNSAFDMALRFCRMAERAYQVDDPKARFINPVWDAQYNGLLSGQGLMLDLQRMDYAYMHRQSVGNQATLRVSLAALDPQALVVLRQSGQVMFSLREELFDEQFPDEYDRRIQGVRIRLDGLEGRGDIAGRLALIGDRVYHDRRRSPEQSASHVLGRQQITLTSADTDTRRLATPEGRLAPFERCGVESTWILSIPAAVQAVRAKRKAFRQQELLAKLADVTLEVTYTARV
jgi:hypothetical protein